MEFYCVLSVGGLLTSYRVQKESEATYKAVLRPGSSKREDIPAEISLQKTGETWQADPWHGEITQSLIHAIESNGQ